MNLLRLALLLSIGLSLQDTQAEEVQASDWLPDHIKFNVFGTIGASHHDEDGLGYRRNLEQKDAVEANKWDFASDSVVGGQVSYLFNDQFTSTLQMVSRNNAWGSYKPEVVSAFVKYAPNESVQFRLGRIPTDSNLGAESRFVGYSYTNIRPSPDLYGLLASYDRYEGFDVNYRHPLGSGVAGLRFNYGNVVGESYLAGESARIKDTDVRGLVANWQTDNVEVRAFDAQLDVNNFDSLVKLANILSLIGTPSSIQRANQIKNATDFKVHIVGGGLIYDMDNWKLHLVGAKVKSGNFPTYHGENGSILIAHRTDQLTPYVSYAYSRYQPESRPLTLPAITALQPLLNAYNSASEILTIKQSTFSLGMRYDINEHYALKMQVDKINAASTPLTLSTRTTDSDKDMTLFTIALDFFY